MTTTARARYKGHRFPAEIIGHAVCLYFRFPLALRMVQRESRGLTNRAQNSHQPTRRRERQMKNFKSAGKTQRFLSAHDQINNPFTLRRRDHATAAEHRASRTQTFRVWAEICGVAAMI